MGLFGAIGRETKGAVRSLGYDLRRSKRFRRIGVIAVATVAGGVIATGALVRGGAGVPGIADGDDADIIEGWFGLGSDTTGQDAEAADTAAEEEAPRGGDAADPSAEESTAGAATQGRGSGGGTGGRSPDLVPIGGDDGTRGPTEEESSPTQEPTTEEPTEEPTETTPTEEPTSGEPTQEPTSEAPTTDPGSSESVTMSHTPSEEPSSESASAPAQAEKGSVAPIPRKGPVGG
ncbi:hypothetical protein [Glycomyces artemisiae]|uniref:Uncharacterized protein n=1 Tax=Glycomyces artemisiae TaxID=1076443 RepID=A0A2T0UKG0_9ACTN|nr:hypothetical protein [Glycomyces artemisiae]PRY58431.1 hypothetical protein B0I28_105144 [Glycomyces artemisiae]